MVDLGDAKLKIGVVDTASAKLDSINAKMDGLSKTFVKAGAAMVIAGGAIVAALAAMTMKAAEFDTAMREVNTLIGETTEQFAAFKDEVRELSLDMGVNAVESANALYQAISAGIPRENVLTFLEVATKAAIGGVTDTVTAVDALTTVLNAFKIPVEEVQKVADILFVTVKRGKTTFDELSASMFQVAPLAAAAGVRFEEVSAALATITKQGTPTRVAATQLRQAIQAIIKPTEQMRDALKELGFVSGEALIEEVGLARAFDILTSAASGSLDLLGQMFGSVEGLQAVLSVTGQNALTFAEDLAAMEDAAGAATDAFEIMDEGVGRSFAKMKASLDDLVLTIGEALFPALEDLFELIKPGVNLLKEFIKANDFLVTSLGGLGGLLLVGGALLIGLGALINAIRTIRTAWISLLLFMGPAGIAQVIGGLATLGIVLLSINEITKAFQPVPEPALPTQEAIDIAKASGIEIPGFQFGGIIPGPIGQPVPVMAHGGEAFSGVGRSFGSLTINLGSFMGDEASLREFVRAAEGLMGQETHRTSFPSINKTEYFPGSSAT